MFLVRRVRAGGVFLENISWLLVILMRWPALSSNSWRVFSQLNQSACVELEEEKQVVSKLKKSHPSSYRGDHREEHPVDCTEVFYVFGQGFCTNDVEIGGHGISLAETSLRSEGGCVSPVNANFVADWSYTHHNFRDKVTMEAQLGEARFKEVLAYSVISFFYIKFNCYQRFSSF